MGQAFFIYRLYNIVLTSVNASFISGVDKGETTMWKEANRDPDLIMKIDADGEVLFSVINGGKSGWFALGADGTVLGSGFKAPGYAKDFVDAIN